MHTSEAIVVLIYGGGGGGGGGGGYSVSYEFSSNSQ